MSLGIIKSPKEFQTIKLKYSYNEYALKINKNTQNQIFTEYLRIDNWFISIQNHYRHYESYLSQKIKSQTKLRLSRKALEKKVFIYAIFLITSNR